MEETGLDANIVRSSGDLSINEPQFTEIIEEASLKLFSC